MLRHAARDRGAALPRRRDKVAQQVGRDRLLRMRRRRTVHVHVRDVLRQALVIVARGRVEDQVENVKAAQQRSRQVDVVHGRHARVVPAIQRVRRGQNRRAGVERRVDAGLADGDGLLLHDLVNRRAVGVLHLVELVDARNAAVGQDKGAPFQHELVRDGIAQHGGGQTRAGRPAAGRVQTTRRDLGNVLEQLRLGHTRVAHQTHVQLAADLEAIAHRLGAATDQQEQQHFLHVLVPIDLRGDARREPVVQERVGTQRRQCLLNLRRQLHRLVRLFELADVLGLQVRIRKQSGADPPEARVGQRQEDTADLHHIARTHLARQAAVQVHAHRAGNVADGHLVRHLLDADLLVRQKLARAHLGVERRPRLVRRAHAARAKGERHVLPPGDLLEHLGTAHVTRVRIHEDRRLHIRDARHHPAQRQQATEVRGAHLTHGHGRAARGRLEVQHVAPQQRRRKHLGDLARVFFGLLVLHIALHALVSDDVQHVVLVGNVAVRRRKQAVHDITKQIRVALRVPLDRRDQSAADKAPARGAELRNIVELNNEHFLIAVGNPLQLHHVLVHHRVLRRRVNVHGIIA